MNSQQVDLPVNVMAIMSTTKRDGLEVAFKYPPPWSAHELTPNEKDPNHLAVQLAVKGKDDREFAINLVMSAEYARQLNLMVGDNLIFRIIKENKQLDDRWSSSSIHETRQNKWMGRDSNSRPPVCKTGILTRLDYPSRLFLIRSDDN